MLKALAIHTALSMLTMLSLFLSYKSLNAGSAVLTRTTTEAESKIT